MVSDDILEKLTYLKVKKLELTSDIVINSQFQKEYNQVDKLVNRAEASLEALNTRGYKVNQLAAGEEACLKHAAHLSDLLGKSVNSIEEKLVNLSISREKSINTICSKANEKLSLFPQESRSNKQRDLVASLLSKMSLIYRNDDDACSKIEAEIKELKEEINEKEITSLDLEEIVDQLQSEVNSMESELERSNNACAMQEVEVAKSHDDIEKLKAELQNILAQSPCEVLLNKMTEELEIEKNDISVAQQMIEALTNDLDSCFTQYNSFSFASQQEERQEMENFNLEEERYNNEVSAAEQEIRNAEFQLSGIQLKKDLYQRLLEERCANKTVEELEQELDASDSAEAAELEHWENELQLILSTKKDAESQTNEDLEKLAAHLESEKVKLHEIQDEIIQSEKQIEEELSTNAQDWQDFNERKKKVEDELDNLMAEQRKIQSAKEAAKESSILQVALSNSVKFAPVPIKIETMESVIAIENVPGNSLPAIPGLQLFSPNTVKKKEERKKSNSRLVDGFSLEYTDLSRDGNEWVLTESPEIKQTVKRGRKSEPIKSAKQVRAKKSTKKTPVAAAPLEINIEDQIVTMTPAAPPKAFCDDEIMDSLLVGDDEDDGINQGSIFGDSYIANANNNIPAAFRDNDDDLDSLCGDDDDIDLNQGSLFGDSPAKNIRCMPEDIFLNDTSITTLGKNATPPAAASSHSMMDDDSLDGYETDQSIWD